VLKVTWTTGVPIWLVGAKCVELNYSHVLKVTWTAGVPIWVVGARHESVWVTGNNPKLIKRPGFAGKNHPKNY